MYRNTKKLWINMSTRVLKHSYSHYAKNTIHIKNAKKQVNNVNQAVKLHVIHIVIHIM